MSAHYTLTVTPNTLKYPGHSQGEVRNSRAFAVIKTDGSVVTWGSSDYGGDSTAVAIALAGDIDVTQIFSNDSVFAALRADGSVVTWGYSYGGGDSTAVASALAGEIDVTQIYSNGLAFAALRADGSVVTWGYSYGGGDSTAVASALAGDIDVTQIFSTYGAFAALRADGSVVTWGSSDYGGDSTAVARALAGDIDVTQIYSTGGAFAALRADGSVVTWGSSDYGGDSTAVARALAGDIDVTQIYSTSEAFAALRADGSVVTWGHSDYGGGNSRAVASALAGEIDVTQIYSTSFAFAALRADGSVVTWGSSDWGGDSTAVARALAGEIDVTQIYSTDWGAFAALRADGSVVTWGGSGGDSTAVASALAGEIDVTQIFSTYGAFAALRADGSVVTWGDSDYGGNSTAVASALAGEIDVTQIYSTGSAFAALRADGSVVTWGHSDYGGNSTAVASQLSSGVVSFANVATNDVFQTITQAPTGTPTAQLLTGTEDTAYTLTFSELVQGISDADADTLTIENIISNQGVITNNNNGTWLLTPTANYNGLVTITYAITDGYGGRLAATQSFVLSAVNDTPTGSITISGNVMQGQVLTANNYLSDADGLGVLSYQWLVDNVPIKGAIGNTFTLSQQEVNKVISVTASYSDNTGVLESKTSVNTVLVSNVNDSPTGSATAVLTEGSENTPYILNVKELIQGFSDIDDDSLSVANLTSNHGTVVINNNGSWTFTPTSHYMGNVSFAYKVIDNHGGSVNTSLSLYLKSVNDLPTGSLSIVGTAKQNQQLTLNNTLADADGLGTISYQWFANGFALNGATTKTLSLTQAHVGQALSVQASYTDGQGTIENISSAATDAVVNVNDAPLGAVTISGVTGIVQQGEVLTASNTLTDIDGLGEISYQWFAKGVLLGSGAQFTLTQAEVNKPIIVQATYTDGFKFLEKISSGATSAVSNRNDLPTGGVSLSTTTPMIEQTLTASNTLADIDGLGTINYIWTRGSMVLGTGSRYTPVASDLGSALTVTARYTDAFGTVEQVSSSTAAVAALPAAFSVEKNTSLTNENGASAQISVKLAAAPTSDVSLSFSSSDSSEGILTGNVMTFTASNWSTEQTVNVIGQNDYVLEGSQAYSVSAKIETVDSQYKKLSFQTLQFTNEEDLTLTTLGSIPKGTARDTPLLLQGDRTFELTAVDPKTGLFAVRDITPLSDVLQGLDGHDTMQGGELADTLAGGLGNDSLDGGNGSDTLIGDAGNDVLRGGNADNSVDVLQGGAGDDMYYLNDGAIDTIIDKGLLADNDTVIIPARWLTYTLPKSIEQGALEAGFSTSTLLGNLNDNVLTGNSGVNTLVGSMGNDTLVGGVGNDVLNGGPGNDSLQGGVGADKLIGGKGKDSFNLTAEVGTSRDVIVDFTPSDDQLVLDHLLFSQLRAGALPDTQLGFSDHALDKNDYLLYDAKQGVLLYDADASGTGLGVQIAIIGKNLALTAADFMVV